MRILCEALSVSVEDALLLPAVSAELSGPGIVALTGANGTGKTTLLKTLAGRTLPTQGSCTLYASREGGFTGTPAEYDPAFRAEVASLIDTPPMARDMTVSEQLTLVASSWGATADQAEQAADELLERLTISQLAGRFPHELSAGQLQLFAVGLTLSRPGELLLLDEPERHLDDDRVDAVISVLDERAYAGALVVTATHRAEIIERCDRRLDLGPESSR